MLLEQTHQFVSENPEFLLSVLDGQPFPQSGLANGANEQVTQLSPISRTESGHTGSQTLGTDECSAPPTLDCGQLVYRHGITSKIEKGPMSVGPETELAATAGQDRRTAGETCALLLATAGGRASEPATVRDDAGSDRSAPGTNGIDNGGQGQHQNMSYQGAEGEEVLQERAAK